MEVWAMEAYGAAYTLQELLTVKSDDVQVARAFTKASSKETMRWRRRARVLQRAGQGNAIARIGCEVGYSNPVDQQAQQTTALTALG